MKLDVWRCTILGMLASAVVSCGGSSKVGGSTAGATGTAGSTGDSTGGTTGNTTGSTGGTAGSAGSTTGSTGDTVGSTGNTTGSTGGGSSQIAFVIPSTTCPEVSSASVAGLLILVPLGDRVSYSCPGAASACTQYKDFTSISLVVARYDTHGPAQSVGSGTYTVWSGGLPPAGTIATAQVAQTDASCVADATSASSGSITIEGIDGSSVTGSYDVTVAGTQYTGSIQATVCSNDVVQGDVCSGDVHVGACSGDLQCL